MMLKTDERYRCTIQRQNRIEFNLLSYHISWSSRSKHELEAIILSSLYARRSLRRLYQCIKTSVKALCVLHFRVCVPNKKRVDLYCHIYISH